MSIPHQLPLPEPPAGILYLRSEGDILARRELDGYQHLLLHAWRKLGLCGVMIIRGIPTVYLREDEMALSPAEICDLQRLFWNQGVATLLVLIDPHKTRVFSGMVPPSAATPDAEEDADSLQSFVSELNVSAQAIRAHRGTKYEVAVSSYETFCRQVRSGHFYRLNSPEKKAASKKFDPSSMVDAHLLKQLSAVRNVMTRGEQKLPVGIAHAFLGRLLFTCYLVDRKIIDLQDKEYFPKGAWVTLQGALEGTFEAVMERLYKRLFPQLKRDFNGSMFDDTGLDGERGAIRPVHLSAVRDFFGAHDVSKKQQTLAFWPYDFSFIPVETISAIYENFLTKEGDEQKREDGAFYTPRFLAEMTLDLATEGRPSIAGKRFIDPSCGSGIFLVLLFNRLAAEWTGRNPKKAASTTNAAFRAKDKALRDILGLLRGVDKNPTACRIACFSLYLAFLDQFDPSDIRDYIQKSENTKLPNLLRHESGRGKKPDIAVIWEGDFFPLAQTWLKDGDERFDYAVGNPPWAGRGKKQIAQDFMEHVPELLRPSGKAALLLPTKVFFNKTDAFQSVWLRQVTLEKVVQLADYSFILFTGAICPCLIARFTPQPPEIETHRIEYLTPKVARVDLRQGAIPISPTDRKEIPLRLILGACEQKAATMAWKSHFWGTPRDLKFLNHLLALPRLDELAGSESQVNAGRSRWQLGEGFQPLKPTSISDSPKPMTWSMDDSVVAADQISGLATLPAIFTEHLGEYLEIRGYRTDILHRPRAEGIYRPPLVLFNRGFSDAAFFDYPVRFQHALRSIAGPESDAGELMFLAVYLRSRLARYFVFSIAGSLASERDQVHTYEVMQLPFFLLDNEQFATPRHAEIVQVVASKFKGLKAAMEKSASDASDWVTAPKLPGMDEGTKDASAADRKKWMARWRKKTSKLQEEVEPLIYEYFGLIDQERALVEDTWEIFDKSDTPGTLDTPMPTLEPIGADGLKAYADMLAETLQSWSIDHALSTRLTAGVDENLGVAVLKVEQIKGRGKFQTAPLSDELAAAVERIEDAATIANGTLVYLCDETWWFEGATITVAKPALRGRWTRTAAINDATEIYATIQQSRPNA